MEGLSGPVITGPMIEAVISSHGRGALATWLVRYQGEWNIVVVGGVDGSEEHVLTYATLMSQTVRRQENGRWRYEYEIAAQTFNSMLFKP